jgi:hypothetical protein
LFGCAGVLAALNAQSGRIINELTVQTFAGAIRGLAGVSAVVWFAMYAALKIGFESDSSAASKADRVFIAAVVLLSLVPLVFAAKVALLLCALYSLAGSRTGDSARRVGFVLLSLTGPLIWGPIILDSFAGPLLGLDAHLVGLVIGTPVDGNVVHFASGPRRFLIAPPCSSVHNISLALVLWTTAAALFRVRFDFRYLAVGALMVAFMFGLNVGRLSTIGLFPGSFTFLHDGAGADLFGWAGIVGAGMISFFGVENAVRRQR